MYWNIVFFWLMLLVPKWSQYAVSLYFSIEIWHSYHMVLVLIDVFSRKVVDNLVLIMFCYLTDFGNEFQIVKHTFVSAVISSQNENCCCLSCQWPQSAFHLIRNYITTVLSNFDIEHDLRDKVWHLKTYFQMNSEKRFPVFSSH
jgi:hypothetical protein